MAKVSIKRILSCYPSTLPANILILENENILARGLIWNILNSHLKQGRTIHYVTYSINIEECKSFLSADLLEKIMFYDFYSDPLGWNGDLKQSERVKQPLEEILKLNDSQNIIIIDNIDGFLNFQPIFNLLQVIKKLKEDKLVIQTVMRCSTDIEESELNSLLYLCRCIVSVEGNPTICKVRWKKESGKILRSCEEISFSDNLTLQVKSTEDSSKKSTIQNDVKELFNATFNLSLTHDQRVSKESIVLPHTRIQIGGGGKIHYTPEAEDDWDDEDPDEDLEI